MPKPKRKTRTFQPEVLAMNRIIAILKPFAHDLQAVSLILITTGAMLHVPLFNVEPEVPPSDTQ